MKTTVMKSVVATMLAAGLASSAAASTCLDLGTLGSSAVFGTSTVGAGSFSECFSFSIAAPFAFSATTVNIPVANPITGGSFFDISGLALNVVNTGAVVATAMTGTGFSSALQYLNYQATVSGVGKGSMGGSYAYAFASAVPEPGEWAMLLSGLGLIGVMVRRRTASAATA